MSVSLTNYIKAVSEAEDPKREIKKWVGSTKGHRLIGDRCMVATYARPERTAGGIILSDNVRQEDLYQGTVGLLVLLGDAAFKYDGSYAFSGEPPKLFDWVVYRPADGFQVAFNKASCRIFSSDSIIGVVSNPLAWY